MVDSYKSEDIPSINKLGTLLNPNFKKLFHIDNLNRNDQIYVYRENKDVLGFIHISINYEVVDLLNIVVDSTRRKENIATVLMDYMISNLSKDIKQILLEVSEDNEAAMNLYYKFNFKIISERANYYGNKKAYVMERKF